MYCKTVIKANRVDKWYRFPLIYLCKTHDKAIWVEYWYFLGVSSHSSVELSMKKKFYNLGAWFALFVSVIYLTVRVHLSSTPSISGPGSATEISSYPLPNCENARHIIVDQLDIHSSLVTSSSAQFRGHMVLMLVTTIFNSIFYSWILMHSEIFLLPSIFDSYIYQMKSCFCIFTQIWNEMKIK